MLFLPALQILLRVTNLYFDVDWKNYKKQFFSLKQLIFYKITN